ncbi:S1 RNA-binding domain-containing protein [Candidatus Woesearchaeota archaeon]|nr:S1 RNA-binding domain-containing protein [Candidatus Woesearchaeota archaeon]
MFYRRSGYPEEGELVICTVTKVQSHSVFVRLDEFDKGGMVHISEVSPGRIRNIRDFVKEDKVIVCMVLRINQERGYIDLSLRRVNEGQKRKKLEEIKQEQKAEKIIEAVAQELKKKPEQLYQEIYTPISKHYLLLHQCFQDFIKNEVSFEDVGVPAQYIKQLSEIVIQRIKPKEVYIGGKIMLQSYAPNGVELVKNALLAGIAQGKEVLQMTYLGGGAYNVLIKGEEYKEAEQVLNKVLHAVETSVPKGKATFSFIREEKKAQAAA